MQLSVLFVHHGSLGGNGGARSSKLSRELVELRLAIGLHTRTRTRRGANNTISTTKGP